MQRPRRCASGLPPVFVLAIVAHAVAAPGDRPATTPIVVRVDHGGFQLVDAAIGALAVLGAVLIAGAYVALVRLRRAEINARAKGDRQ